jgi:hypothetical protein
MDRFSFIVLDVNLEAMQGDASLHRKFREGGNAIIFKANDFADPSLSEVFRKLNGMPALRESASKLGHWSVSSLADHGPTMHRPCTDQTPTPPPYPPHARVRARA